MEECETSLKTVNRALLAICKNPLHLPELKLSFAHLLLDHGASPEYKDSQGRTALHVCFDNHADIELMSLIALHANCNAPDKDGNTLLHKAIEANDEKVVRMLLYSGANPNLVDGMGRLPLARAARLHDGGASFDRLIRHGAKVDLQDSHGQYALASAENPNAALLLLQRGVPSDTQDANGVAPLHNLLGMWCNWQGQDDDDNNTMDVLWQPLVDLMIAQSSSVDLGEKDGRTPLHYACQVSHACAPGYVQALVEKGASLEAAECNGRTPLHVAMASGNYATALRLGQLGANRCVFDKKGRSPLQVVDMDVSTSSHSDDRHNHDAATPLVDLFLHHGFDLQSLDEAGNMPFFFAKNESMHYLMVHSAACQGLFG